MNKHLGMVCVTTIISSSALAADTEPLWQTIGQWYIMIDTTLNNSCFAVSAYERGTVFRIGLNKAGGGIYLLLGNGDWHSLVPGATYQMTAQFGNQSPWTIPARTVTLSGGATALMGYTNDTNIFTEFASQPYVSFTYEGRSVSTLILKDSGKAAAAVLNCQRVMNAAADPFRSSPTPRTAPALSRDPFKPM